MKNVKAILKHPYFLWTFILLIVFIFYLIGISHESIWFDEAYSSNMAGYSFLNIIKNTSMDVHPPLYYILLKLFRLILGNSEWALRILSVFSAVAIVGLGAGPIRRIFGNMNAYIYALLILFTPIVLIMAHEARMYTLVMFTVTTCAIYGYSVLIEKRISNWVIFTVTSLASAYLHYYGLLAVFSLNLIIFVWILIKKRELLKIFFITSIIIILLYLLWLFILMGQAKNVNNNFWIPPVIPSTILLSFFQPFSYKFMFPNNKIITLIILLLFFTTIIYMIIFMIIKKTQQKLAPILFFLGVYICTLLIAVVISLLIVKIFYPRYMIVCIGLLLLSFSISISNIKLKIIRISVISLFVLLNFFTIKNVYIQYFNGPFHDIKDSLGETIKPGELIITSDCFSLGPSLYYFPNIDQFFYVNDIEKKRPFVYDAFKPRLIQETDLNILFAKYKTFWFVKSSSGLSVNAIELLKNQQGWEELTETMIFSHPYSIFNFSVSKFAHTGKLNAIKSTGKLKLKITGINNIPSKIYINLLDHGPIEDGIIPYRSSFIEVKAEEMNHVFDNVEYGEYAIFIIHDENNNQKFDIGPDGIPKEGSYAYKYDPSFGKKLIFDKMKFPFDKSEMVIEIEMEYPPYDFLLEKE